LLEAGYIYELNDGREEAHHWYQRAIESDPKHLGGYLNEGYLYIEMLSYITRDPLGYVIFCTAAELRRRANELLTRNEVEYYLSKLKTDFPALVSVTRYFFSVEELTQRLREQLSMPFSIRNMPAVLETFLSRVS
jgi:type III secretory pathway component EscV